MVRLFVCAKVGGNVAISVKMQDAVALAELKQLEKLSSQALERTMKDIKSRGPSWIAKGVSREYNMSSAQVKANVKLSVTGNGIGDLSFNYKGRMLTPTHFKMAPTAPKDGAYTIKATIKRGQRVTIGKVKKLTKKQRQNIGRNFTRQGKRNSPQSPPMLVSAKAGHLPFQRTKQPGNFDTAIKTLSVPQMIQDGSGKTKDKVSKELNEGIEKRFSHHIDYML